MMVVKMEMTAMAMTTTQCEYWGKRSWMAPMESKSPVPRIHIAWERFPSNCCCWATACHGFVSVSLSKRLLCCSCLLVLLLARHFWLNALLSSFLVWVFGCWLIWCWSWFCLWMIVFCLSLEVDAWGDVFFVMLELIVIFLNDCVCFSLELDVWVGVYFLWCLIWSFQAWI